MSEELKPCPFCNSIRITRLLNFDVDKGYSETIYCEECGAEVHNPLVNWNTRPIEDEKDREIKRLEGELAIQKNLTKQMCFEYQRLDDEKDSWNE